MRAPFNKVIFNDQHLAKREAFAVSLRREKKVLILTKKREQLMTRLNMNKDESQNSVQEPSQLLNALSKLYTLLRTNQFGLIQSQGIEDLQTEVIDCL